MSRAVLTVPLVTLAAVADVRSAADAEAKIAAVAADVVAGSRLVIVLGATPVPFLRSVDHLLHRSGIDLQGANVFALEQTQRYLQRALHRHDGRAS